jgi:hypothetical protein
MAFRILGIARSRWKNQRRRGVPIPVLGEKGADLSEVVSGQSFAVPKDWGYINDVNGGEIAPWWASLFGAKYLKNDATALDFTEYTSEVSVSFVDNTEDLSVTIVYSVNNGTTVTWSSGSFTLQPSDTLRIGAILPPAAGSGYISVVVDGTERGQISYSYSEP